MRQALRKRNCRFGDGATQRHENPQSWLKYLAGDWYDNNGKLILSIHDGYINGCKILYCQGIAGGGGLAGGNFCISESTGNRMIHLSWNIQYNEADSLKVDRRQTLHKYFPFHFESICGIHLGMTKDEVNKMLGNDIKKSFQKRSNSTDRTYFRF